MIEWTAPARRSLLQQPITLIALAWLLLIGMGAVLAPHLSTIDPMAIDTSQELLSPEPDHLLGTDDLGRDMMTRLLWGARRTLGMGLVALSVAVGLGLPAGLVAGVFGGRIDALLMRLVDAMLAFPGLLLAMVVVALLGRGIGPIAIAVGLSSAPAYARLTRSVTVEVKEQPYVEAAQAVGCNTWRIALRHVLPNAAPSLIAYAATRLGRVLLHGSAFNFLGLGVRPGTPEWGVMLADGQRYLRDAPWISTFPGLALSLTVLAATLVGNGLQEAMRPR